MSVSGRFTRCSGSPASTIELSGGRRRFQRRPLVFALAITVLCGVMFTGTADAASYYFSDCGCSAADACHGAYCNVNPGVAGCSTSPAAGTIDNPFCLDPGSTGEKRSFEYVMDGVNTTANPDVAPGDTIYLCAGRCDGSGSAIYHLKSSATDSEGDSFALDAQISGTASSPITIQPYCAGSPLSCETVTLSGDSDGDGLVDSGSPGDLDHILSTRTTAAEFKANYHWLGNPDGDGTRDLIFEKTRELIWDLTEGPNGWVIDGCVFRRNVKQGMWNDQAVGDSGCDAGQGLPLGEISGIRTKNLTGTFTVRNNLFHSICGAVFRTITNPNAVQVLIENNEVYNCQVFNNDFDGRNFIIRGNTIRDTDGITIEGGMHDILVEDNRVACLGQYRLYPGTGSQAGRCRYGITVNSGDTSAGMGVYNITIRRNKVYGAVEAHVSDGNGGYKPGWLSKGIHITAEPPAGLRGNYLIENNMVWYQRHTADSTADRAGIQVRTPEGATIRNNTIYSSREWGISLSEGPSIVTNNLVILTDGGQPLYIGSGAAGSVFTNNHIWDDGTNPPLIGGGLRSATCSQIGSFGTGNICVGTSFVNVSGPKDTWDLHLLASDTVNRDAGVPGPVDDIDKQPRNGAVDIGADEIVAAPAPPTADFSGAPTTGVAPLSVSFTDLSSGSPTAWAWDFQNDGTIDSTAQNPQFTYTAAGTYTVTLTAWNFYGSGVRTRMDYISVSPAPAVLVFTPIGDAYVKSDNPSRNYGLETILKVKLATSSYPATMHSYLMFSVAGVSGPVLSAKLRLYVTDASSLGGSVFAVVSSWLESTLNWSNAPPVGGSPLSTAGATKLGTWLELDLGTSVPADGIYSFAVTPQTTDTAFYSSRESSNAPQLVLTQAP